LSIAKSCNIPLKDDGGNWVSSRQQAPVNTFLHDVNALGQAFPEIFPLGNVYNRKRAITPAQTRHLLLQFDCRAATCRELLFHLFDTEECAKNIIGVSQAVKAGKLDDFVQLYNCPIFKSSLVKAVAKPGGKDAMWVLKKVLPIINLGNPQSDFGPGARVRSISKQIACHRRFAAAAIFVTISPNLMDQPTAVRTTFNSIDNVSFPASVTRDFYDSLRKGSTMLGQNDIHIPLGYRDRARRASNNPVAMALEYERLIFNVLEILFGAAPNSFPTHSGRKNNKTTYNKPSKFEFANPPSNKRAKGIFGHVHAYYGMHETQHRGSLHYHVIVYGGLSPELLDAAGGIPSLCATVTAALDKLYKAELPPSVHLVRHIRNYTATDENLKHALSHATKNGSSNPYHHTPPSSAKQKQWCDSVHNIVNTSGIHRHSFTCHKGCNKKKQCREAYKQRPVPYTRPVLLTSHPPHVYDTQKQPRDQHPPLSSLTIPPRKKPCTRDIRKEPLPKPPPDRCLYWEIKRTTLDLLQDHSHIQSPDNTIKGICLKELFFVLNLQQHDSNLTEKHAIIKWLRSLPPDRILKLHTNMRTRLSTSNLFVVQYNEALSNMTTCNTNVVLLGSCAQSKCAMFYLTPYLSKTKIAMGTCLEAIQTAMKDVRVRPSQHPTESGQPLRTAQHWITRSLNILSSRSEVSDNQCAFCLLGNTMDTTSESFCYINPTEHVSYVLQHRNKPMALPASSPPPPTAALTWDDMVDQYRDTKSFTPFYTTGTDANGKPVKTPVPVVMHYNYRGDTRLQILTRLEYSCLVGIYPFTKKERIALQAQPTPQRVKKGRQMRPRYRFHKSHPLYESHYQALLAKQPTPIFIGGTPPIPTFKSDVVTADERKVANTFSFFWLTLFRPEPVTGPAGVKTLGYSWNAFITYVSKLEKSKTIRERLRFHQLQLNESVYTELADLALRTCLKEAQYCEYQTQAIQCIFKNHTYDEVNHTPYDSSNTGGSTNVCLSFDVAIALQQFNSLQMADPHTVTPTLSPTTTPPPIPCTTATLHAFLTSRNLSVDQTQSLTDTGIVDIFQHSAVDQICLLLAGKGPSQSTPDLDQTKLQHLVARIHAGDIAILIVDEIGTVTPGMLGVIDQRLKQLFDEHLPLGGIHCIFTGDLWQLPSFDGCLAHNMIKYQTFLHLDSHPDELLLLPPKQRTAHRALGRHQMSVAALWRMGCQVLAGFKHFHLTSQQRAKDLAHLAFINDMTDPTKTLDIHALLRTYQPLSQTDLSSNPSKWDFAPYIVTSNRERVNISYYQAVRWARKHKTHVISWKMKHTDWKGAPQQEDMLMDAMNDPAFYQFFVSGAPAYTTGNINPGLNIANGSHLTLHSLIPASPQQEAQLKSLNQHPYGHVLLLDHPPAAVNVVLHHKCTNSNSIKRKIAQIDAQLHSCAVDLTSNGQPIVPIFPSSDSPSKYARLLTIKKKPFTIPGKPGMYNVSKVTIHQTFPFTLGFAMTVHKAQGQTLPAVILCLSQRLNHIQQMTLNALYVAMSRVKHASDIRLLPHGNGSSAMNYEYITHLPHTPYIPSFFHGFRDNQPWNGPLAYEHYIQNNTP